MGKGMTAIHVCNSLKEIVLLCSLETCSLFKVNISKRECEHYRQLPQHRCRRCGGVIRQIETETINSEKEN